MGVKITSLELENVKRIRAISLSPGENGLTVIGGANGQGKTSVLDAIAWALGGEKYRPGAAQRDGSVLPPHLKVTLSNGITVERKGAKGALTVTDSTGKRGGQRLLDDFVEQFALDIPKFLNAGDREKAETLLGIIGVKERLDELTQKEKALYDTRTQIGRDRDRERNHADSLPLYADVPDDPISVGDLAQQYREATEINRRNATLREEETRLRREYDALLAEAKELQRAMEQKLEQIDRATTDALGAKDIDLTEIARQLDSADEANRKIAANTERRKADTAAEALSAKYDELSGEIETVRAERRALLDGAELPLPGLGIEDGHLTMHGKPWDCMSGSEQLRAATAIVSRLKPECRFVLVDKLEQLDADTLREFGAWAEAQDMQVIGTRVSTGSECSIIITDGAADEPQADTAPKWRKGEF